MSRNIQEFTGLKKAIGWYINKISTPNKHDNDILLKKLNDIKNDPCKELEAKRIRDKIVLSNGGFAMKYVKIYYATLRDDSVIADLFQEAMIGITESIDAFDVSKNISFTTYAYFHVKKRLIDFIKNHKLIKAPREIARNIKNINEAMNDLFTRNEKEPSSLEILEWLKLNKNIDVTLTIVDDIKNLLSLNSAENEESFIVEYNDQMIVEDNNKLFSKMANNIINSIKHLSEEEQKKIILRFGIDKDQPHCLEEIDYMLGIKNEINNV